MHLTIKPGGYWAIDTATIMATLLMTHLLQKRLVAALLPFSFLWAFVACVSICEQETLANHSPAELISSNNVNEIRGATECEGCPLSDFSRAATPQRVESILSLDSVAHFAPATFAIHCSDPDVFSNRLDRPFFTDSPPLTLLSTLRI